MAMVCVRLGDTELKMLDQHCMTMKKSRSDVLRQLLANTTVPVLQSDNWMLTFFHLFAMPMTKIKYALRLELNEMWAYIAQCCPTINVKFLGKNYIVTYSKDDKQFVVNISGELHREAMLQLLCEKMEQEIIDGIYKAS